MNPIYYLYSTNLNLALNNIFYLDCSCAVRLSPCTYTIFYFYFNIFFVWGSDIFALSIFILHVNGFSCEIWVNIYGTKTCALLFLCYPMRERKENMKTNFLFKEYFFFKFFFSTILLFSSFLRHITLSLSFLIWFGWISYVFVYYVLILLYAGNVIYMYVYNICFEKLEQRMRLICDIRAIFLLIH